VALVRIEVIATAGSGKPIVSAGMERGLKESMQHAFAYLQTVKDALGLATLLSEKDLTVEAVALTGGRVEMACGAAFYVALISALQARSLQPGTVVLGDLTIQGNLRSVASILEPLQVALDNGAIRALVPVGNKTQFAALPEEVVEKLDVIFYGDMNRLLAKTLAL
jgi:ATP-dependent Lon protease